MVLDPPDRWSDDPPDRWCCTSCLLFPSLYNY